MITATKIEKGIVLGRFQPLHEGHKNVIKHALSEVERLLLVLGSANQIRSIKNPYTYQERVEMISNSFKQEVLQERIAFAPLNDYRYDDKRWEQDLLQTIFSYGFRDAPLYAHMKSDNQYLKNIGLKVRFLESSSSLNATSIRSQMYLNRSLPLNVLADMDFYKQEEISFKNYPFPETLQFNCADAVAVIHGHVVLIQRKSAPGRGSWALPGGYKNSGETFKEAAIRELQEETGIGLGCDHLRRSIIKSYLFDAPSRSFGVSRITNAFYFKLDYNGTSLDFPIIKANDDASKVAWIPLEKIAGNFNLYDDHKDIIFELLKQASGSEVFQLPAYKCVY